jgi:integrase
MGVSRRPTGQWRARIYGEDGRERAKHFPTKAQARRWEAEQIAARSRGQWVDPSDTTTLTEYARIWAAARPHRASTARRVEALIKHHIEPTALGGKRLNSIKQSEVQAWATDRAQHLAPSTMRNLLSMMRSIFGSAVLDRLISVSPAIRIRLADHRPERIVPLTVEQVRALSRAVPTRCEAMIIAQSGLGLRIGELLALRVSDVNFLGRSVRIEFQRDQASRGLVPPKTPRSRRTIPLPTVVADALASHLAEFGSAADGSIFADGSARPWNHVQIQRIFKAGVVAAGLPVSTTPHDLRHAYASWLLNGGESVVMVAERLGHEDATVTLRVYAHVIEGQEDRTRQAIDAVWAPIPDQIRTAEGQLTL